MNLVILFLKCRQKPKLFPTSIKKMIKHQCTKNNLLSRTMVHPQQFHYPFRSTRLSFKETVEQYLAKWAGKPIFLQQLEQQLALEHCKNDFHHYHINYPRRPEGVPGQALRLYGG